MRVGAYQFRVTGDAGINGARMKEGIEKAAEAGVRLLVFPECAATGYPPRCIPSPSAVDFDKMERIYEELGALSEKHRMYLVVGTILRDGSRFFNSAVVFRPDGRRETYSKRALWGWDRDQFSKGEDPGVIEADSLRIGIRICYEVRFPEYFRELYRQQTDLNVILFWDVSSREYPDRLDLIRGHIRTRAVENICPVLSCNTCSNFQTAPTAYVDRSGKILAETEAGKEGLLVCDFEQQPLGFGEQGRKEISDSLVERMNP